MQVSRDQQSPKRPPPKPPIRRLRTLASRIFDSDTATFVKDRVITISRVTGLITDVPATDGKVNYHADTSVDIIDLRSSNVALLPGLIDTHVHMFLHPYAETSWDDQVTKESTAERVIRATVHARNTLMAGYTSVRDLGTEGAEEADLALRKCISSPACLIPGPRLFVATRAIVSTGSYGPKTDLGPNREGVDGKIGAEAADGEAECRRVVRRQIGAGVDVIKIYAGTASDVSLEPKAKLLRRIADYGFRSRNSNVAPNTAATSWPLFSTPELRVMIDTAHSLGTKVCAHAIRDDTIQTLVELGADSIEHGTFMKEGALRVLQGSQGKTVWNPTLATFSRRGPYSEQWKDTKRTFQAALEMGGITMACGGDTGTFPHGGNALEMASMIELGADWHQVLKWNTLGGWKCIRGLQWEGDEGKKRVERFEAAAARQVCEGESEETAFAEIGEWPLGDNDVPLGAIKPGYAADLMAFTRDLWLEWQEGRMGLFGDMEEGTAVSDNPFQYPVHFVMKAGKVYKMDGVEVLSAI
ncbi:hypothetical protein FRB95_009072 [Tulasnella sp. JGI-2019a]|nr:hypothetical protein FRB95_009072 [Tulasnella sp. JGI-2019a]